MKPVILLLVFCYSPNEIRINLKFLFIKIILSILNIKSERALQKYRVDSLRKQKMTHEQLFFLIRFNCLFFSFVFLLLFLILRSSQCLFLILLLWVLLKKTRYKVREFFKIKILIHVVLYLIEIFFWINFCFIE